MLVIFGLKFGRKPLVIWSAEARQLFQRIAGELTDMPGVRVGLELKRPVIMRGRRIAVAGYRDGIAVALRGNDREEALRLRGAHVLNRRDGRVVKDMVALPWTVREAWSKLARSAVDSAANL